jgi:UDP-4-amino-4,6-dideoxy-N-acetyl-beta-L-altrosamine N-acetyltransferase
MLESDLDLVRAWRNDPRIRRHMFTSHEIDASEHRRWFYSASRDASRLLLVFELAGVASGFVQFSDDAGTGVADWGFYLAPDAPRGTGLRMGQTALSYAFEHKRYQKVCGRALSDNESSRRLHLSLGFVQEGVQRAQHFDGDSFHDVVLFGLLAQEWPGKTGNPNG